MLSSCVRVIGKYEINIYLFKLYLNIAINVFFIKIGYLKLKTLKKKRFSCSRFLLLLELLVMKN